MNENLYEATVSYAKYIKEHQDNVKKAWFEVKNKCNNIIIILGGEDRNMIDGLIEKHDNSKYSAEEFASYRQYFYPVETEIEPGIIEIEGKNADVFNAGWKHHYQNNPHHNEYWIDGGIDSNTFEYLKPKTEENMLNRWLVDIIVHCNTEPFYTVEMVCDWIAMGYKFKDSAKDYYAKNKVKMDLPEWKDKLVMTILDNVYQQ